MPLNPYGVSIDKSLYITDFTTFNNTSTCKSSLNVSGTAAINNSLTCSSLMLVVHQTQGHYLLKTLQGYKIHFSK
jgi:hypothetical protein